MQLLNLQVGPHKERREMADSKKVRREDTLVEWREVYKTTRREE